MPQNRAAWGENSLPEPKQKNLFTLYISYMRNLFSIILILSGTMSIVVFILDTSTFVPLYVGIAFILVAFLNAFLEFYQEMKSKQVLEGFKAMMEQTTAVIRDAAMLTIPSDEVVVGDLVLFKQGDVVSADARIISHISLKVDMSSLTGESVPAERDSAVSSESADKAKNLIFKGACVTTGSCYAIAIKVGLKTVIGTILRASVGAAVVTGDLGREIEVLIRRIASVAIVTGSLFMGVAFIQGLAVTEALDSAVGIFVAFLPQGLPITITILLTMAAKRMATQSVLVKNLQAVETLGSLTVIATDKTGTLTKNQMEVSGAWVHGTIHDTAEGADTAILLDCFAGCTTIRLQKNPVADLDGILADATELGLLRHAAARSYDFLAFNREHEILAEIPFDSARKWNLTVRRSAGGLVAYLKGAPDKLVAGCSLTESQQAEIDQAYRHFASKGQRLIGFAEKAVESEEPYRKDPAEVQLAGFTFLGMLALHDPPKDGVKDAVVRLKKAGIRVFMVTGDHPITAKAIGTQVGIIVGESWEELNTPGDLGRLDQQPAALVLHGDLVDTATDAQWDQIFRAREIVFARTLPRHKLIIVQKLQEQGEIVGSIGDGVNDGPAIKCANLGISMNRTGSDISKEAATMILLDDRFATIVPGVLEGRLIYQNLKKSIRYTMTHIFPEVAAFAAWVLFLIPPPLTPILVLMIDVGSELGPALSFAYEPPELDLLALPPRKRHLKPQPRPAAMTLREKVGHGWARCSQPWRLGQTGESLIDAELTRWVYLQGGVIEAVGCFGAYLITFAVKRVPLSYLWYAEGVYFQSDAPAIPLTNGTSATGSQQVSIMRSAQSAYYLSIIIGQLFNLFLTKSRFSSPLSKRTFQNRHTYMGAAAAVLVGSFVVFIPGVQVAFETDFPSAVALCAPVVSGIFLVFWECMRHHLHKKRDIKPEQHA